MGNFSFVSNAQFRPFSYLEMLQPLAAYTQEYNAIEEGLGELGTKADVFKSLASQQNDPETYQAYTNYANELNSVANDLSNHGLNVSSRRKLVDMKRRYSSDIIPMEQAFNRRKELTDEQRKARLQDDTLRYESEASTISLDDLIKDPSLSYKSFSGKNIINISSKAAASIAKEARKDPRAWRQILDGQYHEAKMQNGATSEEVLAVMQGDVNANPRLRKIIDDAVSSSGVMDWKGVKDKDGNLTEYGENLLNQVMDYAGQGLWSAIGETTYKELTNQGWKKLEAPAQPNINTLAINPLNIYSQRERDEAIDNTSKYKDYFSVDENGEMYLNEKGKKAYKFGVVKAVSLGKGAHNLREGFRAFMDDLMGDTETSLSELNKREPDGAAITKAWLSYYNELDAVQNQYDATKSTEFDYKVSASLQQQIKNLMKVAYGNTPIEEVDYDRSGNFNIENTGNTIDGDDFIGKDYTISNIRMSGSNITAMVMDKKGNVKRIKFPKGVNHTMQTNIASTLTHAKVKQNDKIKLVKNIQERIQKDPTSYVTPEEMQLIRVLDNDYKVLVNNAHFYMSLVLGTNKTKDLDFEQIGY